MSRAFISLSLILTSIVIAGSASGASGTAKIDRDAACVGGLNANDWAPAKARGMKLPVMIWICGGGIVNGGGHRVG
jgi:hypothetical protein